MQERVAEDARQDAVQRRITELYTKAADQLGSDKAPVRLAGLYALEGLAQDNESQRQTIVNVLCAYLRMPYDTAPTDQRTAPPSPSADAAEDVTRQREIRQQAQERQVRLTAQRILTDHLKPGDDPDHPAATFWGDTDLDLTGATLIDFEMTKCHVRTARFGDASFAGDAVFGGASFAGDARFDGASFAGNAQFDGASFAGVVARFSRASFTRDAVFSGASFADDYAGFGGASFGGDAVFGEVSFAGQAGFDGVGFAGYVGFRGATFAGKAVFAGATLVGPTRFDRARFGGVAQFGKANFTEPAEFDGAWMCGAGSLPAGWALSTTPGVPEPGAEGEWRQMVRVPVAPGPSPDGTDGEDLPDGS